MPLTSSEDDWIVPLYRKPRYTREPIPIVHPQVSWWQRFWISVCAFMHRG